MLYIEHRSAVVRVLFGSLKASCCSCHDLESTCVHDCCHAVKRGWERVCLYFAGLCSFLFTCLSICLSVSKVDVSESAVRTVILIGAFIRSSCLPGWNFSLQVGAGIIWLLDSCQHRFTVEGKHTHFQYTLHLSPVSYPHSFLSFHQQQHLAEKY